MKLPTREQLVKRRAIVLQDMAAKMEAEDFHGVADCAMDAREIDATLRVLESNEEFQQRVHELETLLVGVRGESDQWPDSIRAERIAAGRPVFAVKADAD